jgi:hypothetical protein
VQEILRLPGVAADRPNAIGVRDRRTPGTNVLERLWAALRGNTNFEHLEATDRWATWQRPDEEQDDASASDHGAATDRRD